MQRGHWLESWTTFKVSCVFFYFLDSGDCFIRTSESMISMFLCCNSEAVTAVSFKPLLQSSICVQTYFSKFYFVALIKN